MNQGVQEVHAWNNYILGTYSRLFHNVEIRDARHKMDHYLVLGCLCGAAFDVNLLYLGKRTRFPIRPPETPYKEDCMFSELQRGIPRRPWR